MLKQMLKPYSFMHQNVKMEKEHRTELNKVLMFISPILDINVSMAEEMGKILVFQFKHKVLQFFMSWLPNILRNILTKIMIIFSL